MSRSLLDKQQKNEQSAAPFRGSSRAWRTGAGADSTLWHAEGQCAVTIPIHHQRNATMNDSTILNRRQFLRATGQAATTLAAASTFAPAILAAEAPAKTVGVGCIGLGTRGGDLINAVAAVPGRTSPPKPGSGNKRRPDSAGLP